MKIITISKIGYNAPSGANWAYGIWKIDLIDTKNTYCNSYTVKENFGGDSRFEEEMKKAGVLVIETKGAYTGTGTPKITGISKLQNIEDKDFINEVIEWYNKQNYEKENN